MPHVDKKQVTCFINNVCNAACIYCYAKEERTGVKQRLDIEFAKVAIRDYFRDGHCQLRFFGAGEPTLDMDPIKELYGYAKGIVGDRLITEIQTNGYFDEPTAQWIGNHITNIWLSWDGPPDIQNYQRPKKDDNAPASIVEENARTMIALKKHGAPGFVGARPTITKRSFNIQDQLISYFAGFGIKAIYSTPIFMPVAKDDARYPADLGPIDMMTYAESFLKAYEFAKQKGAYFGSFLMINFDKKSCYHCRSCLPTPHLTYDGYVSCCDMAMSVSSPAHMHSLIYGKWLSQEKRIEYYQWRIERIRTRMACNIAKCRDCNLSENCAGGCLGETLNETHNFYGYKKESCEAIKFLAENLPVNDIEIPYLHP